MKQQDMQSQLHDLLLNKEEAKPIIVAYGMMNAGKSYLLNMLAGHAGHEFVKTNDIRETVDNVRWPFRNCLVSD